MIKSSLSFIIMLLSTAIFSQVDENSVMGLPTATTLEMNNITPQLGSILYNITDDKIYRYTSTGWQTNETNTNSYVGSFIISTSGNISVSNVPFRPSSITFKAHANVESFGLNNDNQSANNDRGIRNSFGHMNGFARLEANGTTITQNVIFNGSHGNSINDISRFSSNTLAIGVRYGNQNGNFLGSITGELSSFDNNGFTINITYTNGNITDTSPAGTTVDVLPTDINNEGIIVMFTAHR